MTIETKYNIGDEVYFLHDNSVHKAKVDTTRIEVGRYFHVHPLVTYGISYGCDMISLCEDKLFSTKEELLKSL